MAILEWGVRLQPLPASPRRPSSMSGRVCPDGMMETITSTYRAPDQPSRIGFDNRSDIL